jgi:transposase
MWQGVPAMKKYKVTLTDEERGELQALISRGKGAARALCHARILLKTDARPVGSEWDDATISAALEVGVTTVERVRKRFVEEGLEEALGRKQPRREYERRLDGRGEAHLIAVTCGRAPEGRARWTLQLLAERMVTLGYAETLSRETVRRTLKKTISSRG